MGADRCSDIPTRRKARQGIPHHTDITELEREEYPVAAGIGWGGMISKEILEDLAFIKKSSSHGYKEGACQGMMIKFMNTELKTPIRL